MIALSSSTLFMLMSVVVAENKMDKRLLLLNGEQDLVSGFHRMSVLVEELVKKNNETASELQNVKRHTTQLEATLLQIQTKLSSTDGKSTYVRWGRTSCPGNGSELVYSGIVGASHQSHSGGAANYICMSKEPLWGQYDDAVGAGAKIYGTEYDFAGEPTHGSSFWGQDLFDNDVPCAVCATHRPMNIMIPGRNRCTAGWTEEYHGYLVAGWYDHEKASEYICLDERPEDIPGGSANSDGDPFAMVEAICGALTCPPYVNGREVTCVVCTK